MTAIYINPLVVLDLDKPDADSLKKAKRRKLMEFELAEDGMIEINKQKISKNDFLVMAELLDTPQNIEFFGLLKKECYLLEAFLTSADTAFFSLYNPLPQFENADFIDFVRPFYLPQFDKILLKTYKDEDANLLKLLFKPAQFISNKDEDAAYTSLYQHINQQITSLEDFAPEIKKTNSQYNYYNLNTIFEAVAKLAKPDALNVLPDFFQSKRNNIASTINQIAAVSFNKHKDFDMPMQLLCLAKKLKIDSQQQDPIDKNIEAIESQRPANKNPFQSQQKAEQQKAEQQKEQTQKEQAQRNKAAQAHKPVKNYDEAQTLLRQLNNDLQQRQINPAEALRQLTQNLNIAALNALPNDLPQQYDWRDELARRLLDLARQAHSQYNDKENALKILALASRLHLQPNMAKTIAETQLQWLRKKGSTHIHHAPPAPPPAWQPPPQQWQPPQNNHYPQNNQPDNQPIIIIVILVIVGIIAIFLANK